MSCQNCLKPKNLCLCEWIVPLSTKLHILFLQHPQEPKEALSSARLAHLSLPNSTLKIGLSWKNLDAALGEHPTSLSAQAASWAVLYLGSVKPMQHPTNPLHFVSKKGLPVPAPTELQGLVLLDGTWSQAKALWWRNPWLLKLKRAVLTPSKPSLYRELRHEPRRECLSTLESTAEALVALGENPEVEVQLKALFKQLLTKKRGLLPSEQN